MLRPAELVNSSMEVPMSVEIAVAKEDYSQVFTAFTILGSGMGEQESKDTNKTTAVPPQPPPPRKKRFVYTYIHVHVHTK